MGKQGCGKSILTLGVVWALCLAGVGCQVSVNWGGKKDQSQPAWMRPTGPAAAPSADGFQPAGFRDQRSEPLPGPRTTEPPRDSDGRPVRPMPMPNDGQSPMPREMPGHLIPGAHVETPHCQTPLPTELQMTTHPPYMIEPPDILLIDAVRLIPKPPYRVEPLDVLLIQVTGTFPDQPIIGQYTVGPDGAISLGFTYGSVRVAGLTLEQAQATVRGHLSKILKTPQVAIGLAQFRGLQLIRGEHLVRPDGTISLGTYGCVYVAGMTLNQARHVVEEYLGQYLLDPEVSIDVFAYNSKAYYVIADAAGYGQQIARFPITGKETVLDAIQNIGGVPAFGSRKKIWVARPSPACNSCVQVLPVDWQAIVRGGSTQTNYQLFPGDRVFIASDPLIKLDNALAKIIAPIERILGVTLLGSATVNSFSNSGNNNNGNNGVLFVQ